MKKELCRTTAFYVPVDAINGDRVEFPPAEVHHLREVVRIRSGELVRVLDGCGACYRVVLESSPEGSVLVGRVLSVERSEAEKPSISAALALGRKARSRVAVEKLAELGCHRIVPLLTEYTSYRGNPAREVEKWLPVCQAALKQSGNCFLTGIGVPLTFEEFIGKVNGEDTRPVFCFKDREPVERKRSRMALCRCASEYILVIGPEGGFSTTEQELIEDSGALRLHLGGADLRFETAAVAGYILLRESLRRDLYFY
ncbi:MAG: RsmE family RNA methyltransferase [Gemmatimonadota bacterium]|nr:RsmE family RNA methyltransferase [Gemmatimonadota bacterium]